MCHAMKTFQMGGKLILDLANNTTSHPLKNIDTIIPKGHQFSSNIYIRHTPPPHPLFLEHL
jgi:hypothetical protein